MSLDSSASPGASGVTHGAAAWCNLGRKSSGVRVQAASCVWLVAVIWASSAPLARGAGPAGQEVSQPAPEAQGLEWARRLRTVAPEQASTNRAILRIRGREGRRQVPVTVITRPGGDRWEVEYRVGGDEGKEPREVRTIFYSTGGPPRFDAKPAEASTSLADGAKKAGDLAIGGSDFLLKELGMEFLHWPEQRLRGRELSNGRWCQVLESRSGKAEGPASVRSWIDEKLGVVLSAEVYDARNLRLKQFSITQFREQGDRWTCSVSMVDDQRGTKTELSFDGPVPR